MLQPDQLEMRFDAPRRIRGTARDPELESLCASLLRKAGAAKIADIVRVVWSSRLRSAAGRADSRSQTITLNPLLLEHGDAEVDRTVRHELAHLLAHFRAGRRRIQPHGEEWRAACHELGIGGEARCHTLPFPIARRARRYLYRCARCSREFPRVRKIRRRLACLDCCRKFNGGRFDPAAQLELVRQ